jgi:aspartate/glutamate racemase
MNQIVGKLLPGHGSRIHIVSLDIFRYVDLLNKSQWSKVIEFLLEGVDQLVKSGIDFLIIGSNTSRYFLLTYFVNKILL